MVEPHIIVAFGSQTGCAKDISEVGRQPQLLIVVTTSAAFRMRTQFLATEPSDPQSIGKAVSDLERAHSPTSG